MRRERDSCAASGSTDPSVRDRSSCKVLDANYGYIFERQIDLTAVLAIRSTHYEYVTRRQR